jgi:hypothetical protein
MLRKFNAKKYQIAKLSKREEIGSKPILTTAPVEPVAKAPAVTKAPKLRAKKSTK